jgi:hypothetical protein
MPRRREIRWWHMERVGPRLVGAQRGVADNRAGCRGGVEVDRPIPPRRMGIDLSQQIHVRQDGAQFIGHPVQLVAGERESRQSRDRRHFLVRRHYNSFWRFA